LYSLDSIPGQRNKVGGCLGTTTVRKVARISIWQFAMATSEIKHIPGNASGSPGREGEISPEMTFEVLRITKTTFATYVFWFFVRGPVIQLV
jgi:hypothetical protein